MLVHVDGTGQSVMSSMMVVHDAPFDKTSYVSEDAHIANLKRLDKHSDCSIILSHWLAKAPSVVAHEAESGFSIRSRPHTLNTAATHLIMLLHAQFAVIVLQHDSTCQGLTRTSVHCSM